MCLRTKCQKYQTAGTVAKLRAKEALGDDQSPTQKGGHAIRNIRVRLFVLILYQDFILNTESIM